MAKKGKVLQTVISIAGEISPTLGKTIDNVYGKLDNVNTKALAVGAAVAGTVVAVGKAALEAGKYLNDLGAEFDKANDTIRIGTGATGDALEALMDDFDALYKSVPTTMDDASQAIADYNTRLGLTGEELQNLSKQAIQVSDMLGDDLGTVIEESSQAFQQWNLSADDMGEAMDYIFKVSQSTGTGFSDLMSNMQAFGPQLQEMGYSFEEASALMGQMEKAGVNTSEVLSAMKKSVTTLAKDGIGAAEGLAMYAEQIKNAGTEAEATAIASELFGARAGSTMAAAIRDGTLAVDDLTRSLMASDETIAGAAEDTYDYTEKMKVMKQRLDVALKPLANTVFDGLNAVMPLLEQGIEWLTPKLEYLAENGADWLQGLIDKIGPIASTLFPALLDISKPLLDIAMKILNGFIVPLIKPLTALVKSLLPAIAPLVEGVIAFLSPLADILSAVVGFVGEIVSWVSQGLTWVVDLIFGGDTEDFNKAANLRGFATGGFTSGLSIAGEDPNYPTEAVLSFNPAYRSQNLSYWAEAGRMLGADSSDFSLGGESGGTYYDMSGISFAPQIIVQGNADKESIMEAIEEEYPEFIDFLEEWLAGRGKPVYV